MFQMMSVKLQLLSLCFHELFAPEVPVLAGERNHVRH
jgi:hypothetical protein